MAIRNILHNELILFGDKGGVGKTTCAPATAIALLPKRTLLVSTDPAHSLGDCLGQEIGDEITRVERAENLYALEISAGIEHLTRRERENLLSLPVPGADEVMGLKRLMDLMEEAAFEKYVLDTAPTGHALRLLSMLDIFDEWINVFYDLRRKHRDYEKAFGRRDRADEFLVTLKTSTAKLRDLLRSQKTEFVVVTAAEYLVTEETKDIISELRSSGITMRHLIFNKLFPDLDSHFSKVRRQEEQRLVEETRSMLSQLQVTEVCLQPTEPRGIDNLRSFASLLYS